MVYFGAVQLHTVRHNHIHGLPAITFALPSCRYIHTQPRHRRGPASVRITIHRQDRLGRSDLSSAGTRMLLVGQCRSCQRTQLATEASVSAECGLLRRLFGVTRRKIVPASENCSCIGNRAINYAVRCCTFSYQYAWNTRLCKSCTAPVPVCNHNKNVTCKWYADMIALHLVQFSFFTNLVFLLL